MRRVSVNRRIILNHETKKTVLSNGFLLVPRTRVELARESSHYPLKVACLPIPPPGQMARQKYNFFDTVYHFQKKNFYV